MTTLLVTGSRHFTDEDLVRKAIDAELAFARSGSFMLVVGDCPSGADLFAQRAAERHSGVITVVRFIANWDKNGKAAGPIRNKRMVDFVKERDGSKLCLSFWKDGQLNAGTRNCVALAQEAGIEVYRFHEPVERW